MIDAIGRQTASVMARPPEDRCSTTGADDGRVPVARRGGGRTSSPIACGELSEDLLCLGHGGEKGRWPIEACPKWEVRQGERLELGDMIRSGTWRFRVKSRTLPTPALSLPLQGTERRKHIAAPQAGPPVSVEQPVTGYSTHCIFGRLTQNAVVEGESKKKQIVLLGAGLRGLEFCKTFPASGQR